MAKVHNVTHDVIVYLTKYKGNTQKAFMYDNEFYYEIYRGLRSVNVNLKLNSIGSASIGIVLPGKESEGIKDVDDKILLKRKLKWKSTVRPGSDKLETINYRATKNFISLDEFTEYIINNEYDQFNYSSRDIEILEDNLKNNNPSLVSLGSFTVRSGEKVKIDKNPERDYFPVYSTDELEDEEDKSIGERLRSIWKGDTKKADSPNDNTDLLGTKVDYYPILDKSRTQCFFKPMDKVIIYASNRFQDPQDEDYKYSKIFEGLIDSSNVVYSNGKYNVTLSCRDLCKWLEISQFNINPALDNKKFKSLAETFKSESGTVTVFTSNLAGRSPVDIIKTMILGTVSTDENTGLLEIDPYYYKTLWSSNSKELANEYKGKLIRKIILPDGTLDPDIKNDPYIDELKKAFIGARTGNQSLNTGERIGYFIKSVPVKGCGAITLSEPKEKVKGDKTKQEYKIINIKQETNFNDEKLFIDPNINEFPPVNKMLRGNFQIWEHNYESRYQIIKRIIELLEIEFFMDRDGVLTLKPPYYNFNPGDLYDLDGDGDFQVINGDQYLIDDSEITQYSFNETDNGLVTVFFVNGEVQFLGGALPYVANTSFRFDEKLAKQFGLRIQKKPLPILGDQESDEQRKLYAESYINRMNAKYRSGNLTIQMRPELHLGRTIALFRGRTGSWTSSQKKRFGTNDFNPLDVEDDSTIYFLKNIEDKKNRKISFKNRFAKNMELPPTLIDEDLNSIVVYYISGISHSWSPGSQSTTKLELTHGRFWNSQFGVLNYTKKEGSNVLRA